MEWIELEQPGGSFARSERGLGVHHISPESVNLSEFKSGLGLTELDLLLAAPERQTAATVCERLRPRVSCFPQKRGWLALARVNRGELNRRGASFRSGRAIRCRARLGHRLCSDPSRKPAPTVLR